MSDFLLIRAGHDEGQWEWARYAASGECLQRASGDNPAEVARGQRVIYALPAAHVSQHPVALPLRGPKLLAAAPYALEDALAEDIDALHFAIAPGQEAAVHVVRQDLLRSTLELIESWGPADILAVVPEYALLPAAGPDRPLLYVGPEGWWLQSVQGPILPMPPGGLPGWDQSLNGESVQLICSAGSRPPEGLQVDGQGEVGSLLDLPFRLEHLRKSSLLQGAFARQSSQAAWLGKLKWPAALAASFLLLHCALLGWAVYNTAAEAEAARLQAEEAFRTTFPGITRIVDMRVQASQALAAAESGGSHSTVLELMRIGAVALSKTPGLQLDNLQFRERAIYLSLSGKELQALERLRGELEKDNSVRLEVQSAQAGNEGVQIRLKLEKA